jgi:hypothetical protein
MTVSTIERAYQLARAGEVPDVPSLKRRLNAEGCRAVDALLAPRGVHGHLSAICAAAYKPPVSEADPVPSPTATEHEPA